MDTIHFVSNLLNTIPVPEGLEDGNQFERAWAAFNGN